MSDPEIFDALKGAWAMVPAHRRIQFAQQVINYAAALNMSEATGTDPKG